MDGLNVYRVTRVADVLADFRALQYHIAAAPAHPPHPDDHYTEGWVVLRQCALDAQHILQCAADTSVPRASGGEEEQKKAELKQVLLDACARRHAAQKIYSRLEAAKRWVGYREHILQGGSPSASNQAQLAACDDQLRTELSAISDELIYVDTQLSDQAMGRWTAEDPSLRSILRWLRARR